ARPPSRPQPPTQTSAAGTSFSSSELLPIASLSKQNTGLRSSVSQPVLLRVRVFASADVHFTTTISVPSDMYIADLTELLCQKKRLQNPASDWVLCLANLTLALPLDRTVASLEGKTDLALVKRSWAAENGLGAGIRRGGDPSASIFKRQSEAAPHQKLGMGTSDFSQTYKKYTVQRKIAIGRHERVLAIDGDYIHIMPSETKAFFDSMKTTSFHITLIASCKLTGRGGGFKINVWRDGHQKRYEFEAVNGKQAAEIISSIRNLMKMYQSERNSLLPGARYTAIRR
ncbi:target of rapamycin complex 2 subunit MAPKAP1/AVO1, partial [Tremellales sp. Uapishka_1]